MKIKTPTKKHALKILDLLDHGLTSGKGYPEPGKMCVEAAVCYAMGLPHGDSPPCVSPAVRTFKIALNDSHWSSPMARANGLRRIAVAQLGSNAIDENIFVGYLVTHIVKRILSSMLKSIGLTKAAAKCAGVVTLDEVSRASLAARAAANAASCFTACRAADLAAHAVEYLYEAAYIPEYARSAAEVAAHTADARIRSATDIACAADVAADIAFNAARVSTDLPCAADSVLRLAAEIGVEALIEAKSPGIKFLKLVKI